MLDELLDLVNEHDEVIGQEYRLEVYNKKLNNFRVVNAFLVNEKKEVWIPRRSRTKKLFPFCLDASMGGHVMAGETYDQAFARELHEELNLKIDLLQYQCCARLAPNQHNVSAYMRVYIIQTNVSPDYNQADFDSAAWYAIDDLQKSIQLGEATKGDLPVLINTLQGLLIHR
jgi:isopentenyl-diphosphate delta-isomerase